MTALPLGVLIAVSLLVTGCGSTGDDDDGAGAADAASPDAGLGSVGLTCSPASGERLRRRLTEGGGAVVTDGFHDLVLDTDCNLGSLDGELRCLPSPTADGALFSTDALCTDQLLRPGLAEPPGFHRAFVYADDFCSVAQVFRQLGVPIAMVGGETLYVATLEGCVAVTAEAGTYYPLSAPVPAADFALLTASASTGSRLHTTIYDGADGSRACDGSLFDGDASCLLLDAEDGALRCLVQPTTGTAIRLYDDAACSDPHDVNLVDVACGAVEPSVVWRPVPTSCGRYQVQEVAGAAGDVALYAGNPDSCTGFTPGPSQTIHELGPVVAPFGFAAATPDRIATGDRLDTAVLRLEDGPVQWAYGYFDTVLDTTCAFQLALDAAVRCVPTPLAGFANQTAQAVDRFSDPACTVPVKVGRRSLLCSPEQPPATFATEYAGDGVHAYAVIGTYPDPVYQLSDVTCIAEAAGFELLTLGAELAPAAMVEGSVRVD